MARVPVVRVPQAQPLKLLHGGDYNPDQWLESPDVLREDIRLMRLARVNAVSIDIFAWVALEPEEGRFAFQWLDDAVDRLTDASIGIVLATPTGARPAWMSRKYPEVLRVQANRVRNLHGARHNHCYTSPIYREKTAVINTELATRYGDNPGVLLWHLSNEYGGECHCPLCQDAFRDWLKDRYEHDLDAVNRAWWTSFWSHTYTDWDQVESPAPHGEQSVHGLVLDWKRFVTHQTRDFMRHEIASIRAVRDDIPITTNLMGFYPGLDYFKLAADLDIVSWDSYPSWHRPDDEHGPDADWRLAGEVGTAHDLMRGCKRDKPFLLMESVPSATNWARVPKRKRPGAHLASSLLAVAHGSDSVQYFQWRKGRGSSEKFHGAVVDHVGNEHTREFKDVAHVGQALEQIAEVAGSLYPAEAAVIFDWENRWAIDEAQGFRNDGRKAYVETVEHHAHALSRLSVNVDLIDSEQSLDRYKLVVAPMLYMVKPGVAERIGEFVRKGGVLVVTYWSGIVDQNDLCFTGGFPGPLSEILGIWSEEIDALYPGERNTLELNRPFGGAFAGSTSYEITEICDLIHLRGADAVATYGSDFYAGRPALTVNRYGSGSAYYIACRTHQAFLEDFYGQLVADVKPLQAYTEEVEKGVHATLRVTQEDDGSISEYRFLINFSVEERPTPDLLAGEAVIYRSPPVNDGKEPESKAPAPVSSLPAGPYPGSRLAPYAVEIRRRTRR